MGPNLKPRKGTGDSDLAADLDDIEDAPDSSPDLADEIDAEEKEDGAA